MRNRENALQKSPTTPSQVAVVRRREPVAPQDAAVERKLQADVAAWLKARRNTR